VGRTLLADQRGLVQQEARFDTLDRKIDRHFTITSVFLGAAVLGSTEFIRIWKTPWDWLVILFLLSYCVLAGVLFASITVYVVSLRIVDFIGTPVNMDLFRHFERNRYIDVLGAMARGNIDAFEENEHWALTKVRRAALGYRLTVVVIALAAVAALCYLLMPVMV